MDSDGNSNCLIIDISDSDCEEDLSKSLAENDLSMNGIATPNIVSPHNSDGVNSPKVSSTTPDKGSSKSNERQDDNAKSKTNEHKTSKKRTIGRRTSSTKAHWVRMTRAAFTDKVLNINAPKHQLYNMHFSANDDFLVAEPSSVHPAPPSFPDLDLTQLLNWPGIRVEINLDHIQYVREINENCERDIVFGDCEMINMDTIQNPSEVRYLEKVPSSKTHPIVSKEMIESYVTLLMNAAPSFEVVPSKLQEIKSSFRKLLNDIASVPFSTIQTRMIHSYFLNSQKYYQVHDNDSGNNNNNLKVRLREVINPEVNFQLRGNCLSLDQFDVWQTAIEAYFKQMYIYRTASAKDALRDCYKKCLTLKCVTCNETFEGALWVHKLNDHIRCKHFVDKKWTCVKCLRSWDQAKLLSMGWRHNCSASSD